MSHPTGCDCENKRHSHEKAEAEAKIASEAKLQAEKKEPEQLISPRDILIKQLQSRIHAMEFDTREAVLHERYDNIKHTQEVIDGFTTLHSETRKAIETLATTLAKEEELIPPKQLEELAPREDNVEENDNIDMPALELQKNETQRRLSVIQDSVANAKIVRENIVPSQPKPADKWARMSRGKPSVAGREALTKQRNG